MPEPQINHDAERRTVQQNVLAQYGVDQLDPAGLYSFSMDPCLKPYSMLEPGVGPRWFKPQGIWYSCAGPANWIAWCCAEDCQRFLSRYLYRLELDYTDVLQLKTDQDILDFTQQYGTHELGWEFTRDIDWARVWRDTAGLEIMPYSWHQRLEPATHWYYGWDCSSGCVWRPEAILNIELVGENPEARTSRQ